MIQLASPHLGMQPPLFFDQVQDELIFSCLLLLPLFGLKVGLTADAKPGYGGLGGYLAGLPNMVYDFLPKFFLRSRPKASLATVSVASNIRLSSVLCASADSSSATRRWSALMPCWSLAV